MGVGSEFHNFTIAGTKLDSFRHVLKSKQPAPRSFHQPEWVTTDLAEIPRTLAVPYFQQVRFFRPRFDPDFTIVANSRR